MLQKPGQVRERFQLDLLQEKDLVPHVAASRFYLLRIVVSELGLESGVDLH